MDTTFLTSVFISSSPLIALSSAALFTGHHHPGTDEMIASSI